MNQNIYSSFSGTLWYVKTYKIIKLYAHITFCRIPASLANKLIFCLNFVRNFMLGMVETYLLAIYQDFSVNKDSKEQKKHSGDFSPLRWHLPQNTAGLLVKI